MNLSGRSAYLQACPACAEENGNNTISMSLMVNYNSDINNSNINTTTFSHECVHRTP